MENKDEKNVEIIKRAYKAFNEADIHTLNELFDDNSSWHSPGRNPFAGVYKGKEEVFTLFGHYGSDTGGNFYVDLKHVLKCDHNRLVGVQHITAMRKGKKLDVWSCNYFKVENGKITEGREHFYDLYAWDEFWA